MTQVVKTIGIYGLLMLLAASVEMNSLFVRCLEKESYQRELALLILEVRRHLRCVQLCGLIWWVCRKTWGIYITWRVVCTGH